MLNIMKKTEIIKLIRVRIGQQVKIKPECLILQYR
jgi:hypothetical protein